MDCSPCPVAATDCTVHGVAAHGHPSSCAAAAAAAAVSSAAGCCAAAADWDSSSGTCSGAGDCGTTDSLCRGRDRKGTGAAGSHPMGRACPNYPVTRQRLPKRVD